MFHHETTCVQTGNSQSYLVEIFLLLLISWLQAKCAQLMNITSQWEWNANNLKGITVRQQQGD